MSQTTSKAVFLSYAREDTDSARRIADALRAFGLEVWFDQAELRGGDIWDTKIRKQIQDCGLFVPIISVNTQARAEGYFRREWRMGVERTRDMSSHVAFITPVVIDDTTQASADVPEEFLRYQWTPLPRGVPTPAFVEQVRKLIEQPRPDFAAGTGGRSTPEIKGQPKWIVAVAAALVIGGGGYLALRPAAKTVAPSANVAPGAQNPEPKAARAIDAKSIAVLPFTNLSDEKDASAFFSDGIHEDILTSLSNVRDLRVVSRTSVMGYRATTKKIADIARELGVAYVLEGSVRRAGNKVRVTGQLIRAATDEHVWAKNYDRDLTDIFAIQSELSQAIAGELKIALTPMEQRLINRRPTENIAAYDLFLKAREQRNTAIRTAAFFKQAEEWLTQALKLDPNFAQASAALAWVHGYQVLFNMDRSDARLARATAAIETAVRLAPDDPYVQLEQAYYYYFCFRNYVRASEILEGLLKWQPNDAATHYALANIQRRQGKWAATFASYQRAAELEPRNTDYAYQLLNIAIRIRKYDVALTVAQRLVALTPEDPWRKWDLAWIHVYVRGSMRELDDFIAGAGATQTAGVIYWRKVVALYRGDLTEALRLDPLQQSLDNRQPYLTDAGSRVMQATDMAVTLAASGDIATARSRVQPFAEQFRERLRTEPANAVVWSQLGMLEALLGERDNALRSARKALELEPESVDAVAGLAHRVRLAFVLAWVGDKDAAIAEYGALLRMPTNVPQVNVYEMRSAPHYFPLRGDPRFEALLKDPKNNEPLF